MARRKAVPSSIIGLGVAAGLAVLMACQAESVDKSGRGVHLSEWKEIPVAEVDLTFPLLVPARVTRAEYRNRDNQINQHRLEFDGGKGTLATEYFPTAWFADATERRMADIETFKAALAKRFEKEFAEVGEIREIRHSRHKAVGFVADVKIQNPGRGRCVAAAVAYRLKNRSGHGNDPGNVDTVATLFYCDDDGKVPDFSRALENVDVVVDRHAFAAALAAK